MTIDEAIKLIQEDVDDTSVDWDSPLGQAYKMSFEALKEIKHLRKTRISRFHKLPGETDSF